MIQIQLSSCFLVKELNALHEKHLTRPALLFDDNEQSQEEEHAIERFSDDLTRKLHQLQRQVENFRKRSQNTATGQGDRLKKNVILSLVSELQEATIEFRQSQSAYLSRKQFSWKFSTAFWACDRIDQKSCFPAGIKHREQQSEMYFGSNLQKQGFSSDRFMPEADDEEDVTLFQRVKISIRNAFFENLMIGTIDEYFVYRGSLLRKTLA